MTTEELDTQEKSGSLDYTLATFIFLLNEEGYSTQNENIQAACTNLKYAANSAFVSRVAQEVSALLDKSMGGSPSLENIQDFLKSSNPSEYNSSAPQELGTALVDAILASLEGGASLSDLQQWFHSQFPEANLLFGFEGANREEKIANIRKYIFNSNRPWLAQIAARSNGGLDTQWVLVEDFTDSVICMDPYPWDDIDEEYVLSTEEFIIRWELAGEGTIAFS